MRCRSCSYFVSTPASTSGLYHLKRERVFHIGGSCAPSRDVSISRLRRHYLASRAERSIHLRRS